MPIVVMLITAFFYGVGSQPKTITNIISYDGPVSSAPSVLVDGCKAEGQKIKAQVEASDKVRYVDVQCIYIPVKDKV